METLKKIVKFVLATVLILLFPILLIFGWGAWIVISPILTVTSIILFPGIIIGFIVFIILKRKG